MTKKLVARMLAEQLSIPQSEALSLVQSMCQAIVETLMIEKRIEIRNFGVFEIKRRKARLARNMSANKTMRVPSRYVVKFKAGKAVTARLNQLKQQETRWKHLREKKPQVPGKRPEPNA